MSPPRQRVEKRLKRSVEGVEAWACVREVARNFRGQGYRASRPKDCALTLAGRPNPGGAAMSAMKYVDRPRTALAWAAGDRRLTRGFLADTAKEK
jgi:hypothetical protein